MIATSIEQSKKLLELGINPKTADMHYEDCIETFKLHASPSEYGYEYNIPAWSLSALLSLMSEYTLRTTIDGRVFCVSENHITDLHNNPIDAAVQMIEWLVTNKYLKV